MTPDPRLADVIGVIDLLGGRAVHAVAGRRETYQPLTCELCSQGDSLELAQSYLELGAGALYVADLDAIQQRPGNRDQIDAIVSLGCEVWLDQGLPMRLDLSNATTPIVGTESIGGAEGLEELSTQFDPSTIALSLDMDQGLVRFASTLSDSQMMPLDVARLAIGKGFRKLIVLELAAVGTGSGPPTSALCRQISQFGADLEIVSGGGIRDLNDVNRLKNAGCMRFLIGTALHNDRKKFLIENGSC